MIVRLDFETGSEAKLGKKDSVGAWRYAEHPTTFIHSLKYKIDGDRIKLWLPGHPFPQELIDAAQNPEAVFVAFNAAFEKAIWYFQLTVKLSIPYPTRWRCTMAACGYRGLPQDLDAVGDALALPVQKDKRGTYLINRLCKRHKPSKKWPTGWVEDPDLFNELYDYNETDVEAEQMVDVTIGELPAAEYQVWLLDQKINERGILVDRVALDAAKGVVESITAEWLRELKDIVAGAFEDTNQVAACVEWCGKQGVALPDLTADTVEEFLAKSSVPAHVKRVLRIRQATSKSSVSKLEAIERCIMEDGRIRGQTRYYGSKTGRWAGMLSQPQNMPGDDEIDMDALISAIKNGDLSEHGDPMQAVSNSLRGMFIAGPGNDLQVSDYGAIEGRGTAWVAGEQWKLDAFASGVEIYCATAEQIFGHSVTKEDNPKERKIGKVCELAFGYQGAVGAWRGFDKSDDYTDEEVQDFKRAWRKKHPATVTAWHELERAAGRAVLTGKPQTYGPVTFDTVSDAAGDWMTCTLPNGRKLWYYDPEVEMEDTPYGPCYEVTCRGRNNKQGGRWTTIHLYGGLYMENIVQAVSRDILVEGMFAVEAAGYPLILHVHDEPVAEPHEDWGSTDHYNSLITRVPLWLPGFPLAAAGWRGKRYHK